MQLVFTMRSGIHLGTKRLVFAYAQFIRKIWDGLLCFVLAVLKFIR